MIMDHGNKGTGSSSALYSGGWGNSEIKATTWLVFYGWPSSSSVHDIQRGFYFYKVTGLKWPWFCRWLVELYTSFHSVDWLVTFRHLQHVPHTVRCCTSDKANVSFTVWSNQNTWNLNISQVLNLVQRWNLTFNKVLVFFQSVRLYFGGLKWFFAESVHHWFYCCCLLGLSLFRQAELVKRDKQCFRYEYLLSWFLHYWTRLVDIYRGRGRLGGC